jgi:putative transcriptional regulator
MVGFTDRLRKRLQGAVAYVRRDTPETAPEVIEPQQPRGVDVPHHIDVKAIRARLSLTQAQFARRFGFSVHTLRHWEQGLRQPEGPTRAYLLVIERDPESVQRALQTS